MGNYIKRLAHLGKEAFVYDMVSKALSFTTEHITDMVLTTFEIENEVVPLRMDTIVFSYISNRAEDRENGIMIVSLDTNEYTDLNCSMIAEKVSNGDMKFHHSFRYVRG